MDEDQAVEMVEICLKDGHYIPKGGDVYEAFQLVLSLAKLQLKEDNEKIY